MRKDVTLYSQKHRHRDKIRIGTIHTKYLSLSLFSSFFVYSNFKFSLSYRIHFFRMKNSFEAIYQNTLAVVFSSSIVEICMSVSLFQLTLVKHFINFMSLFYVPFFRL